MGEKPDRKPCAPPCADRRTTKPGHGTQLLERRNRVLHSVRTTRLSWFATLVAAVVVMGISNAGELAADTASDRFREQILEAERLHNLDRHRELQRLLEELEGEAHSLIGRALNREERAEILWRRARAEFIALELRYRAGELNSDSLEEGIDTVIDRAEEARKLDPAAAEPRFWHAAAVALRAKEEGRLRALRSMRDVRELIGEALERDAELADAHFLMGRLYRELPGRPLSWGSDRAAVSSARRAVELHERARERGRDQEDAGDEAPVFHAFYLSLAENLLNRGWDARERGERRAELLREYRRAESELDRAAAYEATLDLPDISDREEAARLVERALEQLSDAVSYRSGRRGAAGAKRSLRNELDYRHARELQERLR